MRIINRRVIERAIVLFFTVFFTFTVTPMAFTTNTTESFDFTKKYNSKTLYSAHVELLKKYPELLEMEILGYSVDQQPIYVIRLGKKHSEYDVMYHGLIESGNHAREIANPLMVTRMIEDYCKDYYNDTHLPTINVSNVLTQSVMHFIVLTNPDGFNFTQYGIDGLSTQVAKDALKKLNDSKYHLYKSNVRGVDLNRNFPGSYYDLNQTVWKDLWNVKKSYYHSNKPSREFFHGPYAGSEPETQAIMKYVQKYDFRYALSFHSQGQVIYWEQWMLSKEINAKMKKYANLASQVTGYKVLPYLSAETSSGYFADYFSSVTLKPSITVETLTSTAFKHLTATNLTKAYNQIFELPYRFHETAIKEGYLPYRMYIKDIYVRDFSDRAYAEAYAQKVGGKLIEARGMVPSYYLPGVVLREQFVESLILSKFSIDEIDMVAEKVFYDTDSPTVTFAKSIGVISGKDHLFLPQKAITPSEAAVILYNLDRVAGMDMQVDSSANVPKSVPNWAISFVQYALQKGYLTQEDASSYYINMDTLYALMY